MRDYGKVHSKFWSSPTTSPLSDAAKLLDIYLMTSDHTTIAGAFRLPDGYASEDLQWPVEKLHATLHELSGKGFVNRCETTKWVWIKKHLDWNPLENPNQRKSAAKVASQIPDECGWKREFMRVCGPLLGLDPLPDDDRSETVPKPFANQEQKAGTEAGTGEGMQGAAVATPAPPPAAPAPSPAALPKASGMQTFDTWLRGATANGGKAIPGDHASFVYAEQIGLPRGFLRLHWLSFKLRYSGTSKKYTDWRRAFHNSVKGNWFKLWFLKDDEYVLTTAGRQAEREFKDIL